MRYQAMELDSGKWGVIDMSGIGFRMVAAGMERAQAEEWAARLNLRNTWGK